jgi:hypothetical protein
MHYANCRLNREQMLTSLKRDRAKANVVVLDAWH